jgi:hypothetical protein
MHRWGWQLHDPSDPRPVQTAVAAQMDELPIWAQSFDAGPAW